MTAADAFRSPEVCALAGITYRQLDHWDHINLVRPSISTAQGSGSQRLYSAADVAVLTVLNRVREAGPANNLRLLRKIAPIVRSVVESGQTDLVLVITSDDVLVASDDAELVAFVKHHKVVTVLAGFDLPATERDAGPDAPGPNVNTSRAVTSAAAAGL